jgi:hypothetical protein
MVDNGPTLAPIALAACWYGLVVQILSTDDEAYSPDAA